MGGFLWDTFFQKRLETEVLFPVFLLLIPVLLASKDALYSLKESKDNKLYLGKQLILGYL